MQNRTSIETFLSNENKAAETAQTEFCSHLSARELSRLGRAGKSIHRLFQDTLLIERLAHFIIVKPNVMKVIKIIKIKTDLLDTIIKKVVNRNGQIIRNNKPFSLAFGAGDDEMCAALKEEMILFYGSEMAAYTEIQDQLSKKIGEEDKELEAEIKSKLKTLLNSVTQAITDEQFNLGNDADNKLILNPATLDAIAAFRKDFVALQPKIIDKGMHFRMKTLIKYNNAYVKAVIQWRFHQLRYTLFEEGVLSVVLAYLPGNDAQRGSQGLCYFERDPTTVNNRSLKLRFSNIDFYDYLNTPSAKFSNIPSSFIDIAYGNVHVSSCAFVPAYRYLYKIKISNLQILTALPSYAPVDYCLPHNALIEYSKDMKDNTFTEKELVEKIVNFESQIASTHQGQSVPTHLIHFLECLKSELNQHRNKRHSIAKRFDQKVAEMEDKLFDHLIKHGLFNITVPSDTSIENQNTITRLAERVIEKIMPIFLQAVIDDDKKKVEELLIKFPELLLQKPSKNLVIESKLTWQTFEPEYALVMAVKRKQLTMITLLLSHYRQLTTSEEAILVMNQALSAWPYYKTCRKDYKYLEFLTSSESIIIIPKQYTQYAEAMVDVFCQETFPNGQLRNSIGFVKLSDETELALSALLNRLLPEKAVKSDYLDVELALLAAYNACFLRFDTFKNKNQIDAFCVRVIGLLHSMLTPEVAKLFCGGFEAAVTSISNNKTPVISKQATELKLNLGGRPAKDFYRSSRLDFSSLGFTTVCGMNGKLVTPPYISRKCAIREELNSFMEYIKYKQIIFGINCHKPGQIIVQQNRIKLKTLNKF